MTETRILDIQGFSGGEADSKYAGPARSFRAGENIEIRKNQAGFELSCKLVDMGRVFDDSIIYMVNLETLGVKNGGILVCLDNGKIYLNGVLKETLSNGTNAYNKILGVGVNEDSTGTEYIYYVTASSFGNGKIYKSTTDLDTFYLSFKDYQTASGIPDEVFIINDNGVLKIAIKNVVYVLDELEILTNTLQLPGNETIMGMTQHLGFFRIYSNRGTTGVYYTWDGTSELHTDRQEWVNQSVLGVANAGSFDYAVLGFNQFYSDLYIVEGSQKRVVRVNLEAGDSRRLTGRMTMREGILYISGGNSGGNGEDGVYTYGSYYPGTPRSLVLSFAKEGVTLRHHAHSATKSYFAGTDDKVYKILHEYSPTQNGFADSGYTESLSYQGGVWDRLSLDNFKLAFDTNGGSIEVYARTGGSGAFLLMKTITNSEYGSVGRVDVPVGEVIRNGTNLGFFQEIEIRIKIIRGAIISNTPVVKRFTAWLKSTQ